MIAFDSYLPSHSSTEKVAENATKWVTPLRRFIYATLSTSVILSSFLVITEHLVSIGDIMELCLSCFVSLVLVRMVLQGESTICLLDF